MNGRKPLPLIVFWVIWIGLFKAIFLYQFLLGGGLPKGEDQGSPDVIFLTMSAGVLLAATVIRWILIPRATERGKIFVLMIVGMALAETGELLQIFLIGNRYPTTQTSLFIFSIIAATQFIPIYVKHPQQPTAH